MNMRDLVAAAEAAGWEVGRTRRQHWVFTPPSGRRLINGSTPSDSRSILNFAADLRRAGLPIPHRGKAPKKRCPKGLV